MAAGMYGEFATVVEADPFDPDTDASVLRQAMKGFGTDEKTIIDLLTNRSNNQRLVICTVYKTKLGRDLIDDLKSELTGKFEDCIIALMTPRWVYLAEELNKAVAGIGTDEETLVEILAAHTNDEVKEIATVYKELFDKELDEEFSAETSGHFRRLLISLSMAGRDETAFVDEERANEDAQALLEAGEGQWGTDESVFHQIMTGRSPPQLRATFRSYMTLTGRTIEHAIDNEMSGDYKMGMLAIVKCIVNRPAFLAERLYKAMKGMGTDDKTLIRIVTTRAEIDLRAIEYEFEKAFGRTLQHWIAGETSGDYKRVLLTLCR